MCGAVIHRDAADMRDGGAWMRAGIRSVLDATQPAMRSRLLSDVRDSEASGPLGRVPCTAANPTVAAVSVPGGYDPWSRTDALSPGR